MSEPLLRPRASGPPEWRLWPREAPGAPHVAPEETEIAASSPAPFGDPGVFTSVRWPSLFVYPSARPNGAAFLMAPGGGFARVAIGSGTGDIARRLNAAGASAFVLKYRLPSGRWAAGADACLQDAQRAVRLIRSHAARFGVDPKRIGVLGFSAGGYVAASLAARADADVYAPIDAADQESAAANLAGLMFPVITLDRPFAHAPSRAALIGADASPELGARHSPDRYVTPATPPTFLAHAQDDQVVPVENSLAMLDALRRAARPAELHLYATGGHGLNNAALGGPGSWLALFQSWAISHGFFNPKPAR